MGYPFNQVSGDAQLALQQFSAELDGALAAADATPWAFNFGLSHVGKWRTLYPIPIDAIGYVERRGDDKYSTLGERSCSFTPREFFAGVEAKVSVVEAPDFVGWAGAPARIAQATIRHPNKVVAAMLEANDNLSFYRDEQLRTDLGIALFASAHPVNLFKSSLGTFDNDHSAAAINAAMMKAAFVRFATRRASNGEYMGLTPTDLLVPPALAQEAKDFLESDNLLTVLTQNANAATAATGTTNRWKNVVNLVVVPEFTSSAYVYLIDRNGPPPYVVQSAEAPEELLFDKTSEFCKTTGKVKIGYSLIAGAAGCLPHAIERIEITG
jgi:hypothetical protein